MDVSREFKVEIPNKVQEKAVAKKELSKLDIKSIKKRKIRRGPTARDDIANLEVRLLKL